MAAMLILAAAPVRAGQRRGMVPLRGAINQAATPTCSNPDASYFGGPIVQTPTIVAVFWNATVNSTLQANIGQFYADVTQSSYWVALQEYGTVGLSPGSNQAILPGTLGGSVVIVPSTCPASVTSTCRLTDAQVQAELTTQIGQGNLPPPTVDCTGNSNTIYMVAFPPNISLFGPAGVGKSCVSFCAYHNTGAYGTSSVPLVYGALMDVFTGPCADGCGGNATALDNATSIAAHELVESVTDPDIGLDEQDVFASPAAWGDNNNGCGEIADICEDGSAGDTITVSARSWVVQEFWSNRQGKCTSTGPSMPVCAGTNLSNCRLCSCADNGQACGGGTCETTSTNVLYGGCEQCTATGGNCTPGQTCEQSATRAEDDTCQASVSTPVPAIGNKAPLLAALLFLFSLGAAKRSGESAP